MNVALIFPRFKYPTGDIPLGLGYVASCLEKYNKIKPDIYDTTFYSNKEELFSKLKQKKYEIIGFSLMTSMLSDSLEIAEFIKQNTPKTKIIFAGPHPTVLPNETITKKNIDAIVIGEGEMTFVDLLKNNGDFKDIKGLWYKSSSGEIIKNLPRPFIENLDDLPFVNYEDFDIENYFKNWFQLDSVAKNLRGANIITSRGCPFQCTYCQPTLETLFGKRIRKRSAENIVAELEHLKKRYKINAFYFQDDTLIFDKPWVYSICKLMIKKKLNLIFGCNIRANLVDERLIRVMKKAGLRKVSIGMESGSQRVLDKIYRKGITLDEIKNASYIMKKYKVKTQGFFMMGAPTETIKEINQTIKFAVSLPISEATFSVTTPLPHTHLYNDTKNLIKKGLEKFDYYKEYVYESEELTQDKLNFLKRKAYLMFYLSPYRWKHTLSSFLTPQALFKTLNKLRRF